jgi:hypothetical protein
MFRPRLLAAALGAALCASAAHATPTLLAKGSLPGSFSDLSGLSGLMENGVAGNVLGGLGSGLSWAGGNTFLGLPDRGPNATAYNSALDNTASYIARFQTLTLDLQAAPGGALPFTLTPTLTATTLLSSATPLNYGSGAGLGNRYDGTPIGSGAPALNATNNTQYFTGRSDNYNPALGSLNPNNARLDPESIRVSNDGKSVFVSDEYGPYVYQFDRATGARLQSFALPANLAVANLSPIGQTEIDGNPTGRVANKGMEGLAITPDGKTLVGIMQANLEQDKKGNLRIVTIDIASGATKEFAYQLTKGSGVSEIVALNDHEFLVDERDGNGLGGGAGGGTAVVKQFYRIDLTGATDISAVATLPKTLPADIVPVSKALVLDLVSTLQANGVDAQHIPSKIEGMSFGADVMLNGVLTHTLYVANDNDFLAIDPDTGSDNPNQWYVFGVTDADLGTSYVAAAVPEPSTYALMLTGLGVLGWVARRRRR